MKLPEKFEEKNILKNLADYTSCYVTPWSLRVDKKGDSFLNEESHYVSTPGGTVQLKITKVPEGYIAHINEMNPPRKWTPEKAPSFLNVSLENSYGQIVAFSIDEYCKEYYVDKEKFAPGLQLQELKIVQNQDILKTISKKFGNVGTS